MEKCARPSASRSKSVKPSSKVWPLQGQWVGDVERPHFSRWNLMFIRHHVYSSGKMRYPLIARDAGDLKVRVKTDCHRHRILTQIRYGGLHFQNAIGQTVGHLVLMSKRPLRHQVREISRIRAGW